MVKKKRRKVDASKQATSDRSGFRGSCIELPEGLKLWQVKPDQVKKFDVLLGTAGNNPDPDIEKGDPIWRRDYRAHGNVGPKGGLYVCPWAELGKPCPVCEFIEKCDDSKLRDALKIKRRSIWLILDKDDPDAGIQVWDVSHYNFGDQLSTRIATADQEMGWNLYPDPDDGFTLRVSFGDGKWGKSKSFPKAESIDFINRDPLSDELVEEAEKLCPDDWIRVKEYDDLKNILHAAGGGDEDAEEPPVTVKGKEEEAEEEAEEEKPKKEVTRRRSKSAEKPAKEEKKEEEAEEPKEEEVEEEAQEPADVQSDGEWDDDWD